jgi:hypothetical protein
VVPGPGSYRHTFATRKVNGGASLLAISDYLDHQSPQTTRRFCSTLAAPPVPTGKVAPAPLAVIASRD